MPTQATVTLLGTLIQMNPLLVIGPSMAAALTSCLVLRYYWAYRTAHDHDMPWALSSAFNEAMYVIAHAAFGLGVGILFWLSWGLPALIEINWWQRGLLFGLLNTLIFGGLPVLMVRAVLNPLTAWVRIYLIELSCTSIAASLAASWAWSRWL